MAQPPALRDGIAAMQRGDFPSAERELRKQVATHPEDALALSLLGATLDNLKRVPEAAVFHDRAVAKAPRSADVLNNYAAHLWIAGKEAEARKIYVRVIAIDPSHYAANLQLARAALNERKGPDALRYLGNLPSNDPQLLQLRLDALSLTGDYGKALDLCEAALKNDPANFALLYNLGVIATYAGHPGRAREALEAALRREPRNVDVLIALARAHAASRQMEAAIRLLAEAARLDPRRADAQKMLAAAATELGALEDAVAAWQRYLELQPDDDEARRELSYLAAQKGELEQGIAGLEAFVARHPADVVGHYELGQAQRPVSPEKALREFDRALQLDPKYAPARFARGSLYYQEAKPELAVKDLEVAVSLRPDDADSLDRLGQAYAALDRPADAVRVLKRAAEMAPSDSKILLHYGRALADTGSAAESKAVMDRFRQLGPEQKRQVPAGFVEYLGMTAEQRRADYRARVEKEVADHPGDAAPRLAWLKLLIEDRNWEKAAEVASLLPDAALPDAGRALLSAKRYADAIAVFERLPESSRGGEYYLALAASGRMEAIAQALRAAPLRPDFYAQSAAILSERGRVQDTLRFLDEGARLLPGNREILLLRACALEWAGQDGASALHDIEKRWPEWYAGWVAQAVVLKLRGKADESRRAFETASALGAPAGVATLDLKAILAGGLWIPAAP